MGVSPRWAAQPGTVALAQLLHTGQQLMKATALPQPWLCCRFRKCREHGLGGTELCWMDAGCPPCPDSVENQCPCDRYCSLLAHFSHVTQTPVFCHRGQSHLPTAPLQQTGCVLASVTEKHLAMKSLSGGRGLSMGLPRSVLLLFLLLLV